MKFNLSSLLFSLLAAPALCKELHDSLTFTLDGGVLPKPISDHSASLASSGKIYLSGGCDEKNGNVWNDEAKMFLCYSLSDSFFSYDPEEKLFQTLDNLPRKRYRHGSAFVGNQIWLTGGRDDMDNLIPEVDVYDIASGTWKTVGSLTNPVSDHASFASSDSFFVAGGYNQDYTALTAVTKISVSGDNLTEAAAAPLAEARGDIIGVASNDGTSAFVSGGFTHENWCLPLNTNEKYTFSSNTWETLPELGTGRGEHVLVESKNHLYSLGGEYPIYEVCEGGDYVPGTKTVASDKVEVLEDGEKKWEDIVDFPEPLFRFAAIGSASKDEIYVFGGQTKYQAGCQCTPTSDHVWVLKEKESAGYTMSLITTFLAGVVSFAMVFV